MIRWRVLLVLGATCTGLASAATPAPLLSAARWTAPESRAAVLTSEPGQCLAVPSDYAEAERVAIGAAAFRAPLLLGGQAARAGLSCNSCHRGGHDNPDFSYPGLSGEPGTADVTSSLFSSHRGDGTFNPRPIPNLSGDKRLLRIDQSPAAGQLESFLRGLIIEEFDGPEPAPAILAGLASYVRALSPAACGAPQPLTLDGALTRIDRALDQAERLAVRGDGAGARLLVSSARSEMGLIDERYPPPQLDRSATALRRAAAALGKVERRMTNDPLAALADLKLWRKAENRWKRPLQRGGARSLFNPSQLALWLQSGQ
jgi:hypothetical protein